MMSCPREWYFFFTLLKETEQLALMRQALYLTAKFYLKDGIHHVCNSASSFSLSQYFKYWTVFKPLTASPLGF